MAARLMTGWNEDAGYRQTKSKTNGRVATACGVPRADGLPVATCDYVRHLLENFRSARSWN